MVYLAVQGQANARNEFSQFARFPAARLASANLNSIVESALELFQGRLDGIIVSTDLAGSLPFVKADPELIRQAALIVADGFRRRGHQVAVYADAVASMNGRPSQALVNADVDLTEPLPDNWITPLGGSPVNRYPRLER